MENKSLKAIRPIEKFYLLNNGGILFFTAEVKWFDQRFPFYRVPPVP